MAHVMVSYKREDEPRVAVLVRALRAHGLEVWWDQALPGGESWRQHIESAIDQAGCVVVAWSHGSTGPDGGFVRDEANRAKARGVLVPVLIDPVTPPLGFGELQAIDLKRWKGSPKDPFLLDLVAVCRAKLESKPVPPAKAPSVRLYRRVRTGALSALSAGFLWMLSSNFGGVQGAICGIPVAQPLVSDACGAIHLGGRPDREERLAWKLRGPARSHHPLPERGLSPDGRRSAGCGDGEPLDHLVGLAAHGARLCAPVSAAARLGRGGAGRRADTRQNRCGDALRADGRQ